MSGEVTGSSVDPFKEKLSFASLPMYAAKMPSCRVLKTLRSTLAITLHLQQKDKSSADDSFSQR